MSKLFLLALALSSAAHANEGEALLKKIDAFRTNEQSVQVETLVQTTKDGQLDKERRYQVLQRPDGRSLVLFRSPGESGQKVLIVGDDLWMLMPGSARPIRITPLQKLLGDAATGDIATLAWSGNYSVNSIKDCELDGQPCQELDLAAVRPALSYQRIVLRVAKKDAHPMQADLYATSNRKLKSARYSMGQRDGRFTVTAMSLVDEVQTKRATEIQFLSSKPRKLGDELYNPMYLSRNDVK